MLQLVLMPQTQKQLPSHNRLKNEDEYRYKHRFPTRAAAIKWLLTAALDQKLAPKGEK